MAPPEVSPSAETESTPRTRVDESESSPTQEKIKTKPHAPPAGSDGPAKPSPNQAAWPPSENAFGLIGQQAAATKLNNKIALSSGTGRRFTDTLFIGPAGVGKSSLPRAVAKRLFEEDPVFFSGSDLRQPSALIEKLRERKKVPRRARGRVVVGRCLVFIDEVHALGRSTAIALLSAMDDARLATIGGVEYDFANVVFIAATTDKGRLTDAFVSRMDLIPLANYSLDELAGIIWFHAPNFSEVRICHVKFASR